MWIFDLGIELAEKWFHGHYLAETFVEKNYSRVFNAVSSGGIILPGVTRKDVVKEWEDVKNDYMSIPDDVIENEPSYATEIARVLKNNG